MKLLLAGMLLLLTTVSCSRPQSVPIRATTGNPAVAAGNDIDPDTLGNQNEDDDDNDNSTAVNNDDDASPTVVYIQVTPAPTPTPTPVQRAAPVPVPVAPPPYVPQTRPVYRSMHSSGARMWTITWAAIEAAALNYGHVSEGEVFRLVGNPGGPCTVPVYSCWYRPWNMNYLSTQTDCYNPAQSFIGEFMGYACYPNQGVATQALSMMAHPNGWWFYTTSPAEANWGVYYGFRTVGTLYVPY